MAGHPAPALTLCGGWRLTVAGVAHDVATPVRPLVAAVALLGPLSRPRLRTLLFPGPPPSVAAARLREVLGRARRDDAAVLLLARRPGTTDVALAPWVRLDLHRLEHGTRMLVDGDPGALAVLPPDPVVLPDWEAEWVATERDRRLAALTGALRRFCGSRLRAAAPGDALEAAELAVRLDPLDERAVRWLVRAHCALGDLAPAVRAVEELGARLWDDLGVTVEAATLALLPPGAVRAPGPRRAAAS